MTTVAPITDASEMLAAALEQMDGLISGTKEAVQPPTPPEDPVNLEELRTVLTTVGGDSSTLTWEKVPPAIREILEHWTQQTNAYSPSADELQEKVRRLQGDKDSLSLQVSVLTEQIEAQNEKIRDLENFLSHRSDDSHNMESLLQKEMMMRNTLEIQKGSLIREVSELRQQVDTLDRHKTTLMDRLQRTENELNIRSLRSEKNYPINGGMYNSQGSPYLADSELEKMKRKLEAVMAANEEKDKKIEELRLAMLRYKRLQEKLLNSPDPRNENTMDMSTWPTSQTSLETMQSYADKPPMGVPRPTSTSTPVHPGFRSGSPSPRQRMRTESPSPIHSPDDSISRPPKTPPPHSRHIVEHYGTIPRNYPSSVASDAQSSSRPRTPFGKGFIKYKNDCRSCSAPNLAPGEGPPPPGSIVATSSPETGRPIKNKGIKRFFGRLKRSNSQTMSNERSLENFQRGGFRATAGPRLGWTREAHSAKEFMDVPFALWDIEKIVTWLHELGLSSYIGDCKRWVKSGDHLLKATATDLEKEMGIRNPLHRKKLALALQAIGSWDGRSDEFFYLDYHWVLRWLDDVGLPQYKDAFCDARIDGRVLHHLTVEDLTHLKVTNLLHVVSLKQGIHILRMHGFDPACLKRRSAPNEAEPPTPCDVALWTNHRVMEWLRSVNMNECTPNLRGSGVHGALMVFEPRFTADLLATLLSIPPNKTLLRRHLTIEFKKLIGPQIMQQKRQRETEQGYAPLTPSQKVKVNKKSQFSLMRKRTKSELDLDDLVCPLEEERRNSPDNKENVINSPAAQEVSPMQPRLAGK